MGESRRGCTPAQQSMCSSNPLAFTSRFSAVAAELLISRHAPCHKHLFLCKNSIPDGFPGITEKIIAIPAKRLGFPQIRLGPGKDVAPTGIPNFGWSAAAAGLKPLAAAP